jgi:negative regulator of replication initiation
MHPVDVRTSLIRDIPYKGLMTAARRMIEIDVDVHRVIERGRQAFGESENDILRRLLLPARSRRAGPQSEAPPGAPRGASGAPRSRGLWSVEMAGRRIPAANLKHAYRILLRELAVAHPHFLEAFAGETGRARRFVARTPAALYGRSPHLARKHAVPLADGWYFDSNLSAQQVASRARIAARLCGLHYGSDVRIFDNFREI